MSTPEPVTGDLDHRHLVQVVALSSQGVREADAVIVQLGEPLPNVEITSGISVEQAQDIVGTMFLDNSQHSGITFTYNDTDAKEAASVRYGTAAQTATEGNDSRVVGAAQKSANLSDLPDKPAARTNLGLSTVAATGAYADLSSKPTIPSDFSELTGTVPQNALPSIGLTEFLGAVASQAAMLALTGQRGDWCTRTDLGTDWQLIAEPSTSLASWREHVYPASPVSSVNGRTGAVTGLAEQSSLTTTNSTLATHTGNTANPHAVTKAQVGLGSVDNTADAAKPVSTAQQTALDGKANTGHTHGVTDLTATGTKDTTTFLRGDNTWAIPAGGGGGGGITTEDAQDATAALFAAGSHSGVSFAYDDVANSMSVSATGLTWNQITAKPTFATVATSGAYTDLSGRPTLATVATSGAYTDLSGRPTLATVATSGSASDLSTGTVDYARLPTGTAASTVAIGNHSHSALPLGLLVRAVRTTNATTTVTSAERLVLSMSAALSVTAGRAYKLMVPSVGIYGSAANGFTQINVRYTTNGAQPTTASTQLAQAVVPLPTSGIGYSNSVIALYVPGASGTFRAAISYAGSAGNNVTMQGSAAYPVMILVEDLGVDPGASGTNIDT